MNFYCPGYIATSKEIYCQREGYSTSQIGTSSHSPYFTIQVIFCVDKNHNVKRMEESFYNKQVPGEIFARARELNRQHDNIRTFSTWNDVALDVRHFFRRIAALSVSINTGMVTQSISIVRLISIYQSWPFAVAQPYADYIENLKKNDALANKKPNIINEGTHYLEKLYKQLAPGHLSEMYLGTPEIETECRDWANFNI